MISEKFTFISEDNTKVFVYSWKPDANVKMSGVVQIIHGMAEYAGRYQDFAKFLTSKGFAVYANDHRGHGRTAGIAENTGYITNTNSWKSVLKDIFLLNRQIHKIHPDVKIVILGHSMGSFYARAYLDLFPETIHAMILSGTAWHSTKMLHVALMVSKLQCLFMGEKVQSKLLNKVSFGNYNKNFRPNKTPFDWLSRDHSVCKKYNDDQFCGFICTDSFFRELFRLLIFIQSPKLYSNVNTKFPLLIFSGSMDPVGNFSRGPKAMYAFLKNKGFSDLSLNIYREGRHEMLNEINRKEVYKDILNWIRQVIL